MFIGHYAVALAAKKVAPKVSLGTLFLSAQLADLLWPAFLLVGLEHVRIDPGNTAFTPLDFYDYPITHSLIGAIAWSLICGSLYYIFRREIRNSFVLGLVVFSHWVLDFITHRPDLPLGIGSNIYFGLGLWNTIPGTIAVELLLFILGIMVYIRTTSANDRIGTYGFWSLLVILILIYFSNIFGPPPPSARAIAIVGNAAWLFVLWAYWIDRHRTVVISSTP
jgi:membrane-bound metal-dependent hydrolase YbcI (DUF457 family)